ncbi:unnamed protein product [Prunus armeniaca]
MAPPPSTITLGIGTPPKFAVMNKGLRWFAISLVGSEKQSCSAANFMEVLPVLATYICCSGASSTFANLHSKVSCDSTSPSKVFSCPSTALNFSGMINTMLMPRSPCNRVSNSALKASVSSTSSPSYSICSSPYSSVQSSYSLVSRNPVWLSADGSNWLIEDEAGWVESLLGDSVFVSFSIVTKGGFSANFNIPTVIPSCMTSLKTTAIGGMVPRVVPSAILSNLEFLRLGQLVECLYFFL